MTAIAGSFLKPAITNSSVIDINTLSEKNINIMKKVRSGASAHQRNWMNTALAQVVPDIGAA
jgi:hypothetical protein